MRLVLLLAACAGVVNGHRLDEYLQATVLSLEKDHIRGQLRMTPGVAVLPVVLAAIDLNRDGTLSVAESRAYAGRVIDDLRLSVDGRPRELKLSAVRFPPLAAIQQGLGAIEVDFAAAITLQGSHQISFVNHHQQPISVYLANCLSPDDPATQVDQQYRSYEQSEYRIWFSRRRSAEASAWLVAIALAGLLFLRYVGRRPPVSPVSEGRQERDVTPS